mmetsp:Transcript_48275/g.140761  ORF Transcript_48275/g.140761 Transcript_48275/m.140761 type:complete len:282 (+) Transcript_48275:1584-2429(+)
MEGGVHEQTAEVPFWDPMPEREARGKRSEHEKCDGEHRDAVSAAIQPELDAGEGVERKRAPGHTQQHGTDSDGGQLLVIVQRLHGRRVARRPPGEALGHRERAGGGAKDGHEDEGWHVWQCAQRHRNVDVGESVGGPMVQHAPGLLPRVDPTNLRERVHGDAGCGDVGVEHDERHELAQDAGHFVNTGMPAAAKAEQPGPHSDERDGGHLQSDLGHTRHIGEVIHVHGVEVLELDPGGSLQGAPQDDEADRTEEAIRDGRREQQGELSQAQLAHREAAEAR